MANQAFDIYIVGVGGQGVLTIGELIVDAAFLKGIPANFFPTKGMAQRGGFVKAELRLGPEIVGPSISPRGADLVISMELSESLKAIRYLKKDGDFVVYGSVWAPTAVMLGKADYPSPAAVQAEISKAGGHVIYQDPAVLPLHQGQPVAENIYILGAAYATTGLKNLFSAVDLETAITQRWPKGAEANLVAFRAGVAANRI